jgi:hypothetical protein
MTLLCHNDRVALIDVVNLDLDGSSGLLIVTLLVFLLFLLEACNPKSLALQVASQPIPQSLQPQ